MAQPTAYQPAHEFWNDEGINPNFPGSELDIEFAAIDLTLTQTLANLALIQRDDGALANASVGLDQLTAGVKALLGDETTIDELTELLEGLDADVAAAAASAAAALVSENNAETAETNAETAATAAAASAAAAAISATAAQTAETNAETAETNAETAETNAEAAQTAAENARDAALAAQAAAEAAFDDFDDIYLGPKAADPTLDNDGDALVEGQLYWNTGSDALKVYDGAAWQTYLAASGIANLVEDLTPQLGGDLDPNGFGISNDIDIAGTVTAEALIPDSSAVPANGMYLPDTNVLGFATNSGEAFRILSNNLLIIGHTASINIGGVAAGYQQHKTDSSTGIALARWNSANTAGPIFALGRSRSGTIGTNTVVQNSDILGDIIFAADDGTDVVSNGARIRAVVDGTPGVNDVPTRLEFGTASDGAAVVTTRMTIYSTGGVVIGSATGGDKGAGTINAVGVYDDNTLLTCMALAKEFREKQTVDLDYWDSVVPDLEIPAEVEQAHIEERPVTEKVTLTKVELVRQRDGSFEKVESQVEVDMPVTSWTPVYDKDGNGIDAVKEVVTEQVEVPEKVIREAQTIARVHGTARVFKAMIDSGFDPRDPEQYFAKMQSEEALPGMPTKINWVHNTLSAGEMFSRKWLAVEMLAIVTNAMWVKLKDHESRIAALENA